MSFFSIFNKKKNFNLSLSDFKTECNDFEVLSIKLSDDFHDLFPEAKTKNQLGKSSIVIKNTFIILFNEKIEIFYNPTEINLSEKNLINKINQSLNWIAKNEKKINSTITEKLLLVKNRKWLEVNENDLTENDFIKQIKPSSIFFFGKGNSEFSFRNENLFRGHEIILTIDDRNNLGEVSLRG